MDKPAIVTIVMKLNLKSYSDAGHGWLAVKRQLLADWGLLDKITPYSYQRGKTVYLEEDQDCTTFIEEARRRGVEIGFTSKYNERSPIRFYEGFLA